ARREVPAGRPGPAVRGEPPPGGGAALGDLRPLGGPGPGGRGPPPQEFLHPSAREKAIDIGAAALDLRGAGITRELAQRGLYGRRPRAEVGGRQALDYLRVPLARDIVGREPELETVRRIEASAGQRHPVAAAPGQARQKPGATHVGEETDGRLRHGQQRAITCHAMAAMDRKPYAPAHADLVDQGDEGLAIAVDGSIESILFIEELTRQRAAFLARVPNGPSIPPGAQGLLARPLQPAGAN